MSDAPPQEAEAPVSSISDPAKLIRMGTMLQTLLEEIRTDVPDEGGRVRLAQIHQETIEELSEVLSEDLREELQEFNKCCTNNEAPTEGEIRIAPAQLVGWLQGLLRGMQALATAQAAQAQQQLQQVRQGGLPPGAMPPGARRAMPPQGQPMAVPDDDSSNPSGYL